MTTHDYYPLSWPLGWERTDPEDREHSRFTRTAQGNHGWKQQRRLTLHEAYSGLYDELDRLGVDLDKVVVSTNVRVRQDGTPRSDAKKPKDPGVAVYFTLDETEQVLACDKWTDVPSNLRAVSKHIEALRGMDRWGVGSIAQAFHGYREALPEHTGGRPWWEVLGVEADERNPAVLKKAFRARALKCHPDHGGDRNAWDELQEAFKQSAEAS